MQRKPIEARDECEQNSSEFFDSPNSKIIDAIYKLHFTKHSEVKGSLLNIPPLSFGFTSKHGVKAAASYFLIDRFQIWTLEQIH